ncbi:Uncharacterised protein [Mycobacteroides abscessus subsp. abscessus]|nr:Uncharacterised protein [Mycobacteroides abscessus subsp. abscessus]
MVENANVYVSGIFINSPGRNDDRRGYAGVAISCPVYGNFTNEEWKLSLIVSQIMGLQEVCSIRLFLMT